MRIELWQTGFRGAWHRAQWGDRYLPARFGTEPLIQSHTREIYVMPDEGWQSIRLNAGGLTQSSAELLDMRINHDTRTWGFVHNGQPLWQGEVFPYDNRWHIRTVRIQWYGGYNNQDLRSGVLGRIRWRIVDPIYRDPADVAVEGINKILNQHKDCDDFDCDIIGVRAELIQLRREILMSRLGG